MSMAFKTKECESIDQYKEGKCDNNKMLVMGEFCDKTGRGNYYLLTNANKPYAI